MSYYVVPDYWVGGYAVGDAVEITASALSSSEASGSLSTVIKTGISSLSISDLKASFGLANSIAYIANATSTTTINTPKFSVYAGFNSSSLSDVTASISAAHSAAALSHSNGIINISLRLKWEFESEPSYDWIAVNEPLNAWSDISEPSNEWLSISESSEIWTDTSEPTNVWS